MLVISREQSKAEVTSNTGVGVSSNSREDEHVQQMHDEPDDVDAPVDVPLARQQRLHWFHFNHVFLSVVKVGVAWQMLTVMCEYVQNWELVVGVACEARDVRHVVGHPRDRPETVLRYFEDLLHVSDVSEQSRVLHRGQR